MAEHADIWAAIAAAQAEVQQPSRLGKGAFGRKDEKTGKEVKARYLTLADLLEASKIYSSHGLALVRRMAMAEKYLVFGCALRMGNQITDWCEFPVVPEGNTAQKWGSALTYAQRYAIGALLGIAGEDDDGQAASEPAKAETKPAPKPDSRPAEPVKPKAGDWAKTAAQVASVARHGEFKDDTIAKALEAMPFTFSIPSKSGGSPHAVAQTESGGWLCDCEGYRFKGSCGHQTTAEVLYRAAILGPKWSQPKEIRAMDAAELSLAMEETSKVRASFGSAAGRWAWNGGAK